MKDPRVYALDLGSSKVALIAASRDEAGRLVVDEAAMVPHRGVTKGAITDLDATHQAIDEALKAFRGFGVPDAVVVNLGGAQTEGINAQGLVPIVPAGRSITGADVLSVINHSRQVRPEPDREQVLALPREFKVDGSSGVQRPIGLSGSRLEVVTHVLTAPVTQLRNLDRVLERTQLRIEQAIPNAVAVGFGLVDAQAREAGTAIIDLGAQTTTVAVTLGGALAFSVVLPIGSGHVTSDLSKLLKMTTEDAESLKRKHGRALRPTKEDESTVDVRQIGQTEPRHLQRKILYEIIESRMREIAVLCAQQIEKSGYKGLLPGGVVITGGGALLPGTAQLFGQALGEAGARLGTPKVEGAAAVKVSGPEWSVAIGLAAFALRDDGLSVEPANGLDVWRERIRAFFK